MDVDGDGDLDIVSLVSQEWEEIYVFVNDGRGSFTPKRIFGASNEDFGSSRPDLVTGGIHMSYPFDRMSRVTVWINTWGRQ